LSTATTGTGAIHAERPPVRALPQFVTFRDLIRSNRRKSELLVAVMIGLGVALGAALAAAMAVYGGAGAEDLLPSVALGAAAALVAAVLGAMWSWYGGASAILAIAGARPIEKARDPQLFNVVEELAIAAGLPMPAVYLIEDEALNAFATGRDPAHAAVAITTGLRRALSRDELAGVMAHELSHVRHLDIRLAMLMATMVGLIVFACDAFWRIMWRGNWHGTKSRSARGGGKGAGAVILIVMAVAIVLAAIAPMLAMLIRTAISRQREYLADAGAVELTRYPQGLIGALEKLGASTVPLRAANRATAHLYIVNPLSGALRGRGHEASSVFLTHPPLHDRIARLRGLLD
jgi:heat shock protein HtpX